VIDDTLRDEWHRAGVYGTRTLADVMRDGFEANATSIKVYRSAERPRQTTLGEIDQTGRRLASSLWDLGLRPGDTIALQLPNWFENDATIRAAVQLGLVIVPVVHIYGPTELSFIIHHSGAKALVVPDHFRGIDFAERVAQLTGTPGLEHVITAGNTIAAGALSWDELAGRGRAEAPEPTLQADDVCAIVYTSGTTSDPKGVQHTHNTLLAERGGSANISTGPRSSLPSLQLFPAGHIASALGSIFMFAASTTTVAFDTFGPDLVIRAIEEFQLAATAGPPVFLASILDLIESGERDLSSLTSFLVGAASVPGHLVERADGLGVKAFRCYGSSEHPTVTSSGPGDPLHVRAMTDGPCLPNNRVRIVDDDGRDVRLGTQGEIATLGPELFVGYREASMNEDAFLPGGWFRTGDLGLLDTDGNLTVTDRKKDIIIRGGENISAKEVEDILARHPSVLDTAVVAMPDPRLGERVCAFVVLREGRELGMEDIRAHFADAGVAKQKTPERIEAIDELPRTSTGKVQKNELRARLHSS
jgi:non-ribosomal peptide synthetase component E (peptide arylation enzyme)